MISNGIIVVLLFLFAQVVSQSDWDDYYYDITDRAAPRQTTEATDGTNPPMGFLAEKFLDSVQSPKISKATNRQHLSDGHIDTQSGDTPQLRTSEGSFMQNGIATAAELKLVDNRILITSVITGAADKVDAIDENKLLLLSLTASAIGLRDKLKKPEYTCHGQVLVCMASMNKGHVASLKSCMKKLEVCVAQIYQARHKNEDYDYYEDNVEI